MTAKPGPWVATDVDGLTDIVNTETGDVLNLCCTSPDQDAEWELAERIAARLNSTEGDER